MPRNENGTFSLINGNTICPPDYTSNATMEDVGIALAETPTRTEVDSLIGAGVTNFITSTEIDALIASSNTNFITSTAVDDLIESGTTNFITNAEADVLIEAGITNFITNDEVAALIEAGTDNYATKDELSAPTGTVMVFHQASAPTGWSKVTTNGNAAIRVVNDEGGGVGGTQDFTTAFSSHELSGSTADHALTVAEMPSHTHTGSTDGGVAGLQGGNQGRVGSSVAPLDHTPSGSTGGGNGHSHTFAGNEIDLAVKYNDVIFCSKD